MGSKALDAPPPAQSDWAYFLDVDGTLIEIAPRPEAVRVPPSLITLLTDMNRALDGACALISGRQIAELDRLFAPLRLPAAGIHGAEWRRDAEAVSTTAGAKIGGAERTELARSLDEARAVLRSLVGNHQALLLEDKGAAVAVHYRAAPELHDEVISVTDEIARAMPALQAQHGKMVVELRPAGVDKGAAVKRHLAELPFRGRRPVYVGDDLTDEHGFEAVNEADGISIRVGDFASTAARWRLKSVDAVHLWLAGVNMMTRGKVSP